MVSLMPHIQKMEVLYAILAISEMQKNDGEKKSKCSLYA